MKKILFGTVALGVFLAAIATSQAQETAATQHGHAGMPMMMQSCPMNVQGADLSAADVQDGIAVTITTKEGDVSELRRRSEMMAQMHSTSSDMGMMRFSAK